MLLQRSLINYIFIKGQRRMSVSINFSAKNNLLSLFIRIWIETHFTLVCPMTYFNKSLLSSASEISTLCTTENNKVSSVNNLSLDDNSSAR